MKSFLDSLFNRHYRISLFNKIARAIRAFSLTERIIFFFFSGLLALTSFLLVLKVNDHFLIEVPRSGGTLNEGIIGTPRFINPLLAVSESDKDITELVYSGLMRVNTNGDLIPDLAENYTVSPDGLVYTFTLKPNAYFHDGKKVTADDVIFTVQKAQDANIKSPKRANWDGVTVEKISDNQVQFTLKQSYAPFLVNTTLGILPQHIWNGVSDDEFAFSNFNIEPIGSGPYSVYKVQRNSSGIPEYYDLTPFKKFALGTPFISHVILHFYPNDKSLAQAIDDGSVQSVHGIDPEKAKEYSSEGKNVLRFPISRIFGVFFNQNQASVLAHKEVRQALNAAVDKQDIINNVLLGFASELNGPIPAGLPEYEESDLTGDTAEATSTKIDRAIEILTNAGWSKNADGIMQKKTGKTTETLSFTLSTSNTKELKETAEKLKATWQQIGAQVDIKVFEPTDLNQNVIRTRKYDALLFGEVIGKDLDLYAFWHSSQRNDPGLNIAMYTNSKVDTILEQARKTTDPDDQIKKYQQVIAEINKDMPAVFLYTPDMLYLIPDELHGIQIEQVRSSSDRFSDIYKWYIETDKVWKIFSPTTNN